MPYPDRPVLDPLPQFRGTASPQPDPVVQAAAEAYIVEQYQAGRSLREVAELTDRSVTAVRRALDRHGIQRRPRGAERLRSSPH